MFHQIIDTLARNLQEHGGIDISECNIDSTFTQVKKRGYFEKNETEGTKILANTDAGSVVLSVTIGSASPHEVTLAVSTL